MCTLVAARRNALHLIFLDSCQLIIQLSETWHACGLESAYVFEAWPVGMMTVASHSPSHCADSCPSAEELLVSRLASFNNRRVLLIMHAMCCWQVAYVGIYVVQTCFVRTWSWLVGPAQDSYKHFRFDIYDMHVLQQISIIPNSS